MITEVGNTYICEQTFSILKFRKTKYCSRLSDKHVNAVLISTFDIQCEGGYKQISEKNSTSKITLETKYNPFAHKIN